MSGLNLQVGGFGGVKTNSAPQYGSAQSYNSGGNGVTAAAFSPGVTPSYNDASMSPASSAGLAFWIGVGSIAGLWWLRMTLPN